VNGRLSASCQLPEAQVLVGEALGTAQPLALDQFLDGAAPIKTYGKPLLSGVPIYFIRWDNSNHLYAVSDKLYVFTVTPTSVSQSPGSPYALPPLCQGERCSWGLTVVPKL